MSIQTHIDARIASIQQRIDAISGGPAIPVQPPAQGGGFASALQDASAGGPSVPLLAPDGSPVRPLDPSGGGVAQYADQITAAAAKYGVDPKLVQAVMQVESGGNARAVSKAGALGLMQLMPANVAEAGLSDPFDPAQNIDAGTRQLSQLMNQFGGNLDLALAGYNAGPNAVKRFGGIPPYPETQDYVRKIRALMDRQ